MSTGKKGRFIVLEGLEGAGKTTAAKFIRKFIDERTDKTLILTREPGGTKVGEEIRRIVKTSRAPIDIHTELLLMYAARVQLVETVIRPALARGDWVLADRFELSTYAYQGGGRGIDSTIIDQLSAICLPNLKPDLTIFLDIHPQLGLQRIKTRSESDRFEQEELAFFTRVYEAYHQQLKKTSSVVVVNASQPIKRVREAIYEALANLLQEKCYPC